MSRNPLRKAERHLENRAPDARLDNQRTEESVVRRIETGDDDATLEHVRGRRRAPDDAGVEFAEDFGREFLLAATTGDDIGEIESAAAEISEKEGLALHEVEINDGIEDLSEFAERDEDIQ